MSAIICRMLFHRYLISRFAITLMSNIAYKKHAKMNKTKLYSETYKSKYKKVRGLPIRIDKSNVSSVGPLSERNIK